PGRRLRRVPYARRVPAPRSHRLGLGHRLEATLHEPPEPPLADEPAIPDDERSPDDRRPDAARDPEALVRGVVTRVVEVGSPERPPDPWIEQDEVGIATDLDR